MERHFLTKLLFLPALAAFLLGCELNNPIQKVLEGNFLLNRGEEVLATYSYHQALKALRESRRERWVHYNIGNVYLSLGEAEAGLEELKEAAGSRSLEGGPEDSPGSSEDLSEPTLLSPGERKLFFRTHFNLGVAYYDLGMMERAVHSFKLALLARPNSMDAKINLELSLGGLMRAGSEPAGGGSKAAGSEEDSADTLKTLEKIHQEEEPVWGGPAPEEEQVRDRKRDY